MTAYMDSYIINFYTAEDRLKYFFSVYSVIDVLAIVSMVVGVIYAGLETIDAIRVRTTMTTRCIGDCNRSPRGDLSHFLYNIVDYLYFIFVYYASI
jgi:hypothetical protein